VPNSDRPISIPPPAKRTMSTERSFFGDLVDDLAKRLAWLEQVIEGVPDSGALIQIRGWAKALGELHTAVVHVQARLPDPRFSQLFVIEGALAMYLSRLFAWCDELTADFGALAVKLQRNEPVLAVFSHHAVNDSFAQFQQLGADLRVSVDEERPKTPDEQAAWSTFDADFEELLWATEWLHMSLASKPGG